MHSQTTAISLLSYYSNLDEHVEQLLDFMDADFEAMTIPLHIAPGAQPLSCYRNVEERIKRKGGTMQYGWLVMQNGILLEAEHHAVWVNKQQQFIDITPRHQAMKSVVFIPDDRIPYAGVPIDNIRLNKTGNPLVDDLIAVIEMTERIVTNAPTRLNELKVRLSPDQNRAHQHYKEMVGQLVGFIVEGKTAIDPCFCNSKTPYQDCHRPAISAKITADKLKFPQNIIVFSPGAKE